MKLRFLNLIIFLYIIGLSIFSDALASSKNTSSKNNYAAVIYLSDKDIAKWLVYASYSNIAKIDNKLGKLFKPTIQALNGTNTPSDLYYLDLKFQQRKHDLDEVLKNTAWFNVFNNEEIIVEINDDGNGQHLLFDLPKMNIQDLGLAFDDLTTVDNAKNAITHVKAAIDKINSMLPSELRGNSLKKFIGSKSISDKKLNRFYVASVDDSKAIVFSLVQLNNFLTIKLNYLLDVANRASTGVHTPAEMADFDAEFQSYKNELDRMLLTSCQVGNIKMFNGNKLKFKMEGYDREFQFTKLDLEILDLKNDSILDFAAASLSLVHLQLMQSWIRDWVISGTAPFNNAKSKNILADLPFLNLTNQEKVMIKKAYSH